MTVVLKVSGVHPPQQSQYSYWIAKALDKVGVSEDLIIIWPPTKIEYISVVSPEETHRYRLLDAVFIEVSPTNETLANWERILIMLSSLTSQSVVATMMVENTLKVARDGEIF